MFEVGEIMNRARLLSWTLSIVSALLVAGPAADATTRQERTDQWGSETIAVRANQAAQAMKAGKYGAAISHFRALIGLDKNNEDFYLGLCEASRKSDNWGQALMSLEELFDRKPELKTTYAKEFVEALKNAERDSSEIKAAEKLVKPGADGTALSAKVDELVEKSLYEEIYVEPKKLEPEKRKELDASEVHLHKSRASLNYETAFAQSENIVVAEYNKFEKEKDRAITYFTPPKATYKIVEYLKGAPFNRTLPIKYEFHDKIVGEEKPANWKFDEAAMMPKPGTKWILFIPHAVPIAGMLETYHGAWGRQEFTEDNYDKIMRIIQEHRGQAK